jgi:REP element-mobilizing transposase RayT
MPSSPPLDYGIYYHIYNRGNNREDIFIEPRNYTYFLQLYAKHVTIAVETYAYCLLKNHLHILICTKDEETLTNVKGQRAPTPSQCFSNFFNAYAKAINNAYGRTGSLFQNPFKRIIVQSDRHRLRLVTYIHQNSQKHGFTEDFRAWPHSSYRTCLSKRPTRLQRDTVLEWFGGREGFITAHQTTIDAEAISPTHKEYL